MNFALPVFWPAAPEIAMLAMACIALLADLFLAKKIQSIAYMLVQLALIIAAVITIRQFAEPSIVTFNGLYIADQISHLLKLFIYITVFATFVYSRHYVTDRNMPRGDYYVLGLFSTLGMMVLVSAHSFITIYLGLEILSLPIYAMVAMQRTTGTCIEASLKYFVMGAIASGMLLYGMSMIYGATGSLDITHIATAIAAIPVAQQTILFFGLVFIVAGIGFKLAAAPFHMWAPDVYSGAPSSVTLFLSTAPKIAALGMALRLLVFALPALQPQWSQLLIILSVLSMGIGNLLAIAQTNIKRLFAYSAIAHVGYLFLGLLAGTSTGYSATLFYICTYALTSLAAFGLIVLMSHAGFEAENINDFKGLNARSPWFAFLMLLVMFSFAGIPPTVGFFAKFLVLQAIVNVHMVWLAVVAVIFAILGAFYYIRIIKTMYFDANTTTLPIIVPLDMRLVFAVNGLALLGLGLFPGALLQLCRLAF